jgi:NAD(P)-dependent dehydrogenase (short-subunit alcohol dehydrogenase family)
MDQATRPATASTEGAGAIGIPGLRHAVVVLTGASSGIGLASARLLATRAQTLVVHGLDPVASDDGTYVAGDFRRFASVAATARRILEVTDRVDVLINNAGMPGAPERSLTADGHEVTWQVNLLAGALLTELLLRRIAPGGRIVNVASATHYGATLDLEDLELARGPYSPVRAYAHSKLAIVTYSAWLARRLAPSGVDVVSVHPGVIDTGLLHAMFGAGGAPVDDAASVLADLAERRLTSGGYYDEDRLARPNPQALERALQDGLARHVRAATARLAPLTER